MPETTITPDIIMARVLLRAAAEHALVCTQIGIDYDWGYHRERMMAELHDAAKALGYRLVPLDKEETNDG